MGKQAFFRFLTGGALLFLLCACTGTDQDPPQQPSLSVEVSQLQPGQSVTRDNVTFTMLQKSAGVADRDGWFLARGAGGAISVLFPAKFSEGLSSTKATDGAVITVHTLGASADNGIRLLLNCFERSDSRFPAGATESTVKGLESRSQRFRSQPFSRDTISGIEFRGVYENGADFAGQAFTTSRYLCEFMAEFPTADWETMPAVVRRSLDSVRIRQR